MATENDKTYGCLDVTQVEVFPFKESASVGHIRGLATVVLNDQFVVRGLRVTEGENGMFVGYPIDPFYSGDEMRSVCNPVKRELRERIENAVLAKYRAAIADTASEEG